MARSTYQAGSQTGIGSLRQDSSFVAIIATDGHVLLHSPHGDDKWHGGSRQQIRRVAFVPGAFSYQLAVRMPQQVNPIPHYFCY